RRQRLLGQTPADVVNPDLSVDGIADLGDGEDNAAHIEFAGSSSFFAEELEEIDGVITRAQDCVRADRKLLELEKIVADLVQTQRRKLLIFTEYRATQHYLQRRLIEELDV